jgi:hypothetical protein
VVFVDGVPLRAASSLEHAKALSQPYVCCECGIAITRLGKAVAPQRWEYDSARGDWVERRPSSAVGLRA